MQFNNTRFNSSTLICTGRTAEVHRLEPGKIIKILKESFPVAWLQEEAKRGEALNASGLPVPVCYGLVKIDGVTGLVYEDAGRRTIGQNLAEQPWSARSIASQMARIQSQIHKVRPPELESVHELVTQRLQGSPALTSSQKRRALERLSQLPDGAQLCHMEFHPWNVLASPRGLLVIDWDNASRGGPEADIARSYLLIFAPKWYYLPFVATYRRAYLAAVKKFEMVDVELIKAWIPVLAAARTIEQIQGQHQQLLRVVRKNFGA